MNLNKTKQILEKSIDLESGGDIAIAKEFIGIADKLEDVSEKIENIISDVKDIDEKEIKTYEDELSSLLEALGELKSSIEDKDMVVNISLDSVSESLSKIETTIKNIKIPEPKEFPKTISVNNLDNSSVVKAIKEIPDFPIKELSSLISGISSKISDIKLEVPEFDYIRIEEKLNDIVNAIKKIKVSNGSGSGLSTILNKSGNGINPATEEKQDAIITALGNVKIDTGDIDLNTDGLEGKLDTLIAKDYSTSAKQDTQIVNEATMISLVQTLNELNARLQVLSGMANSGAPALRTIPIGSVSTAVTGTLTSVGTLTNFGTGMPATEVAHDINNYTSIVANINNVVVS